MSTMTRRSLLLAGAAAGAGAATAGLVAPGTAHAARTKNLLLAGQFGNLSLVTPGGALLMYYHNNWQWGSGSWLGPFHRGDGFQRFSLLASTGINHTYDNLYLAVDSSGVYGYYWSYLANNGAGAWQNGGAPVELAPRSWTGWQSLKFLVSGGYDDGIDRPDGTEPGSIFYTVDTQGRLYWHRYVGVPGVNGHWALNSGRQIGIGWNGFVYVTAEPEGTVWGVDADGNLRWYRYRHARRGDGDTWEAGAGTVVGTGWRGGTYGFQTVQSGGQGRMYMVDRDGDLRWNYDAWYRYEYPSWYYQTDPPKIGTGWM